MLAVPGFPGRWFFLITPTRPGSPEEYTEKAGNLAASMGFSSISMPQ
jgi:hypothetical protein